MSEPQLCPQCGGEIPAGAPAGFCPKCLVLAGLESQPAADPQPAPTQPPPSPSAAGFLPPTIEQLAARFPQLEILELLGRGGMGAVYKARQRELDRLVAVKVLPPEVGRDPAFAERFTREVAGDGPLEPSKHRGRLRLRQAPLPRQDSGRGRGASLPSPSGRGGGGEGGGGELFYFIMEYVDGVNLRQAIQSGGMDPKRALAIVPQICDALQFAHDEGVVHRDIKPENILIDKRGRVKIADFGLAKLLGQDAADHGLTATHQVMGTLRYMAPEQMEGAKDVDHRADIYSLGVVFYELLTGELPIGRFAPPSKKVEIDVRLDEVVLRALEKEREQRYQHASDVKADVESVKQNPARASQSRAESRATAASSLNQETGAAAGKTFRESRLSWCALSGTVLAPLVLLLPGISVMEEVYGHVPNWYDALVLPALLAPFGTTILGVGAFRQIKRSGGRIHGMPLAVFDALLLPLLALDLAIIYALGMLLALAYIFVFRGNPPYGAEKGIFRLAVLLSAGPVVWLDWRIVRGVSRLATSYQSPAPASPRMSEGKTSLWTLIRERWHEPRPLRQVSVGKISLWTSIAGLVVITGLGQVMRLLLAIMLGILLGPGALRIVEGPLGFVVFLLALLFGVLLEVVALRYGIDTRRTRSGLAGLIVSAISLVLVALYCLIGLFVILQRT